jgi:hypothetical protein
MASLGSFLRKQYTRSRSSDGRPELDYGKLNDHAPVAEESRIYPVMAL